MEKLVANVIYASDINHMYEDKKNSSGYMSDLMIKFICNSH